MKLLAIVSALAAGLPTAATAQTDGILLLSNIAGGCHEFHIIDDAMYYSDASVVEVIQDETFTLNLVIDSDNRYYSVFEDDSIGCWHVEPVEIDAE